MVRTEKMVLMAYLLVEMEPQLLVVTEAMEVEGVMLMEGTEAQAMVVTEAQAMVVTEGTVGTEVPPLQEMEVMLLVVMAEMAVEEVTEVMHLVVLDEAMKNYRFQYTKLAFSSFSSSLNIGELNHYRHGSVSTLSLSAILILSTDKDPVAGVAYG